MQKLERDSPFENIQLITAKGKCPQVATCHCDQCPHPYIPAEKAAAGHSHLDVSVDSRR